MLVVELQDFHGSSIRYLPEDFIDNKFLIDHCCKIWFLALLCFCFSFFLSLFCCLSLRLLCLFSVASPALREQVDLFAKMPTEEFLTRLVKSRAPGVSTVVVDDSEDKGPEVVSRDVISIAEATGAGNSESNVALVKDRDKKRHRDGSASRGHHSKKLKKPSSCLKSESLPFSVKIGSLSCARVTVGVSSGSELPGSGLALCKDYADKVSFLLIHCLSPYRCFS